jgi:hypothetical protein
MLRADESMTGADIARLRLRAQRIAPPAAASPAAVVEHLGAVQAQDYAGALWSIALRTPAATRADVERAIAERTIVRTWPMRGTLHFVPAEDARWMLELLTPRIVGSFAGRYRWLELDDDAFRRSRSILERALARRHVLTRAALYAELERGGVSPAGQRGIAIAQRLCMERMLVFGPHDEKQPTFALFDEWIPRSIQLDRDDALRTIAARYVAGHGPVTLKDFARWTGLAVADARRGLDLARPSLERALVEGTEFYMTHEPPPASAPAPRAHLLPGFDELMLGYGDRSASLAPEHAGRICPGANGMFLSTLVLDGRVCGTWRRSARGAKVTVAASPFVPLTASQQRAFDAPLRRYAHFLGGDASLDWLD